MGKADAGEGGKGKKNSDLQQKSPAEFFAGEWQSAALLHLLADLKHPQDQNPEPQFAIPHNHSQKTRTSLALTTWVDAGTVGT
jgi:hypothetical protein